jgi:hypothetical protein
VDRSFPGPFRTLSLSRDRKYIILDSQIDRISLQAGHVEVKVIAFLVFNNIDRRASTLLPFLRMKVLKEPIHSIEQPAVVWERAFVPDFHLNEPPATERKSGLTDATCLVFVLSNRLN